MEKEKTGTDTNAAAEGHAESTEVTLLNISRSETNVNVSLANSIISWFGSLLKSENTKKDES